MLKHRLMVALPLAAVTLVAFLTPGKIGGIAFLLLVSAAMLLAVYEFFGITKKLGYPGMPDLVMAVGLARLLISAIVLNLPPHHKMTEQQYAQLFSQRDFMLTDCICLGILLLMIMYRICKTELTKENVLGAFISLGAYLYICWPLALATRLFYMGGPDGMWSRSLVLFLLVVVRLGDTGGYAIGCSSAKFLPGGNHKISPVLSPKKSWEGLFGSMLFSSLAAAGLWFWLAPQLSAANVLSEFTLPVVVGFAIVSAVIGFMGDLAESALKRVADVKDSGRVPGLGGLLDLMDSVLVNIPVFFFLLILLGLFC